MGSIEVATEPTEQSVACCGGETENGINDGIPSNPLGELQMTGEGTSTLVERVNFAKMELKQKASRLFQAKQYQEALQLYRQIVQVISQSPSSQNDNEGDLHARADVLILMITSCNNAATCSMSMATAATNHGSVGQGEQLSQDSYQDANIFAQQAQSLIATLQRNKGGEIHAILKHDYADSKIFGEWLVKSIFIQAKVRAVRYQDYAQANTLIQEARSIVRTYLDNISTKSNSKKILVSLDRDLIKLHKYCREQQQVVTQREKEQAKAMFGGKETKTVSDALTSPDSFIPRDEGSINIPNVPSLGVDLIGNGNRRRDKGLNVPTKSSDFAQDEGSIDIPSVPFLGVDVIGNGNRRRDKDLKVSKKNGDLAQVGDSDRPVDVASLLSPSSFSPRSVMNLYDYGDQDCDESTIPLSPALPPPSLRSSSPPPPSPQSILLPPPPSPLTPRSRKRVSFSEAPPAVKEFVPSLSEHSSDHKDRSHRDLEWYEDSEVWIGMGLFAATCALASYAVFSLATLGRRQGRGD
jgi:tetratricopeptide (TPR) repeat protein